MVVADVPPTTYVEYERLAPESRVAEAQKDLLAQFLREALGVTQSVVEFRSDNIDAESASRFLKVKCLQCARADGELLIVKGSLRREENLADGRERYQFLVRDASGRETSWRTELAPFEAKYVVVASRGSMSGTSVGEDELSIKVCAPDLRCISGSLDSVVRAKEKVQSWRGMRWNRNAAINSQVSEHFFAQDIVVKNGDLVKVLIETQGGLFLRTSGRAVTSGAKGASVRVEVSPFQRIMGSTTYSTTNGRKIIDATVRGPGEVTYGM